MKRFVNQIFLNAKVCTLIHENNLFFEKTCDYEKNYISFQWTHDKNGMKKILCWQGKNCKLSNVSPAKI